MFFFFNDTATTEIYTLSLHDALPISREMQPGRGGGDAAVVRRVHGLVALTVVGIRSEEHTSELQSPCNLVCRLLLEKKNYATSQNHRYAVNHQSVRSASVSLLVSVHD